MIDIVTVFRRSLANLAPSLSASVLTLCLAWGCFAISAARGQTPPSDPQTSPLPANWREIKEGVGGYPAGPMLEIAVRHTHADKLEMFRWRSQFIAMLSAQPGPLVEREWRSVWSLPENTGAGTWTGMTWWENQQRWQDMANMLFPTPVARNWLQTLDMTLIFVKPLDRTFDLRTLAQSGGQVLELGLLVFPTSAGHEPAAMVKYLDALKAKGVEVYRFAVYPNPTGFDGPFTVAYRHNGPPDTAGEQWFVYMASYDTAASRMRLQASDEVHGAFEALTDATVREHSDIQLMTRTTSQVCIKRTTQECSLDPDDCHVGEMGSGDTWAASCGERPQPCLTDGSVCSRLSPGTCGAVGGRLIDACPATANP